MLRKQTFIFILLVLVTLLFRFPGHARGNDGIVLTEWDKSLLSLINLSRNNPVLIAEYLELDPDQVFLEIPEISVFWDTNKPELAFDPVLQAATIDFVEDIIKNDRFGNTEELFPGQKQRVMDSGYPSIKYFDYLSLIATTNYMSSDKAIVSLYRQFFLDQVDSFKKMEDSIFDYGLKGAGLAMVPARLTVSGNKRNVYIFATNFGRSLLNNIEMEIYAFINQARKNSRVALEVLGISMDEAAGYLPGQEYLLNFELTPLVARPAISRIVPHVYVQPGDVITDQPNFPAYIWTGLFLDGFDEKMIADSILRKSFAKDPYGFFQLVFSLDTNAVDFIINEDPEATNGQTSYRLIADRYQVQRKNGGLWLGQVDISGLDRAEILEKSVLILSNSMGMVSKSGIDESGLFMLNLPFGSHAWKILASGSTLSSGMIFGKNIDQWQDIELLSDPEYDPNDS